MASPMPDWEPVTTAVFMCVSFTSGSLRRDDQREFLPNVDSDRRDARRDEFA